MSKENSLTIIIVEKTAKLKTLTVKDYKEEELFKKCGFKKDTDFKKQTEWTVKHDNKKYVISLYGKLEGKAGMENKTELPPPVDSKLFYGALALVGQIKDETNKKTLTNLSISLWDILYQKLYGGFENLNNDLDDNDINDDDDMNLNAKGKKGKGQKKVIKNSNNDGEDGDEESEYSDYDSEEDSEDNCTDENDANGFNDEPLVIPDISTELCEEEYDYDT